MCQGDLRGRYTFISDSGNSVNDYFLMSVNLFESAADKCKLNVLERIESDHMPVELALNVKRCMPNAIMNEAGCMVDEFVVKYCWKTECAAAFSSLMNSGDVQYELVNAAALIETDVNAALNKFNDVIKQQAECMKKRISMGGKSLQREWFDHECQTARSHVRKMLHKCRKSKDVIDKNIYCIARREYKYLIVRKKKSYNAGLIADLSNSVKSQKLFWETMKKLSRRKTQPRHNITLDDWFQHFKNVLEKDTHVAIVDVVDGAVDENADVNDEGNDEDVVEHVLDRPISKEEVTLAIRKLKNGKSAGPDGLIGELFKHSGEAVVMFLVRLFNVLFDSGFYPDNWKESIILPLFKKGQINDTNNYRGISLCDVSSKLYSSIINNRLQEWISIKLMILLVNIKLDLKKIIQQLTISLHSWRPFRNSLQITENCM
ncbi:hypothetical protein V1264_023441 [Littorina saxatilis]|uniref:Uncharacterized protein n=1 Tax=Littorina saxatilis TaxID=31220 RepID=A0AAN9BBE2_9CAEN